jgi:dihydropteroate synthase
MKDTRFNFRFGRRTYDLASRTHIMGILNVTPDSFSDGGKFLSVPKAVEHALSMAADGADIIDVGGESTRPKGSAYGKGAEPVSEQEEIDRVLPVIEQLVSASDIPVSIDTTKSGVARHALQAGAVIVNDISGLNRDPAMAGVVGDASASAVIMHMRGTPETMQQDTYYADLFGEIEGALRNGIDRGRQHGIRQMIIDPGVGFGKDVHDNFRLLAGLERFATLECPVMVGPSRKSFIGAATDLPVDQRLEGTIAAVVAAVLHGAHIVRVHDVPEVVRAVKVADEVRRAGLNGKH